MPVQDSALILELPEEIDIIDEPLPTPKENDPDAVPMTPRPVE